MGFWTDAFDHFTDNLEIFNAAAGDVMANLNPLSEQFLSGDAVQTADVVERQLAVEQGREYDPTRAQGSAQGGLELVVEGVRDTAGDVTAAAGEVVADAGKAAGGLLDALSNPWVLGAIGAVVLGVLVAPYAVPAIVAVTK